MPIENDYGVAPRISRWHNPTPYRQKIRVCMNGAWRTVRWEPGETIEMDSQYDRAVQIVICQEDECNGRGPKFTDQGLPSINCQPCTRGHSGHIMGGQAPLLERVGMGDVKNPQLDPDEVERQKVAAEARKIVQNQKAIKEAILSAELEMKAPPVAPAGKPAKQQPQP